MTSPQETNGLYEVRTIAQYGIVKFKVPSLQEQNSYTFIGSSRIDFEIRYTSDGNIVILDKSIFMILIESERFSDN